jgi:hypothetical protein
VHPDKQRDNFFEGLVSEERVKRFVALDSEKDDVLAFVVAISALRG